MEKLWTTTEAAKFLGVNEVDVEELVRRGTLTGYKLGGQFLRFRPDQVQALKGKIPFRPMAGKPAAQRKDPWPTQLRDFLYFYDFYLVSATLLAALVVYLVASG